MVSSEIINDTDGIYTLKEARGTTYTHIAELQGKGGSFTIHCDPNATYREFWVGTTSSRDEVITVSSDDLQEHSGIVITRSGTTNETVKRMIKRKYEQGSTRDWTKVLNQSDRDCIIKRVNSTGEEKVGTLKKVKGSFYIFRDLPTDPNDLAVSFKDHKVVLTEDTEVSVPIPSSDCADNEQIIIKSTVSDSKTVLTVHKEPTVGCVVPRAPKKKNPLTSFLQFAGKVVGL